MPAQILAADGAILPGVGAFGDAMEHLRESGMDDVVNAVCSAASRCWASASGCSCCSRSSEEHGEHKGLELAAGRGGALSAGRLQGAAYGLEPAELQAAGESAIFKGMEEGHVYFVHSYHVQPERTAICWPSQTIINR